VPRMEVAHIETPTPLNPLGCKGAGEGGTIPSPAAIALAIEDALSDLNVKVNRLPVSPEVLLKSIEEAKCLRALNSSSSSTGEDCGEGA